MLTVEGDLAKANPIRYAGYYYDDETKNYYLQARYYNPANGAFLALDPHPGDDDEPLSQNGYSYANGNPVMNVDPNGKKAWKNAWYNSRGFLVGAINAAIFLTTSAIFGGIGGLLIRLGKKSLSKSKKILFATNLKKKLRNRGVSYIIAGSISSAVGILINISGFWLNPGSSIFNYLDRKDKKPRNGYFNGF